MVKKFIILIISISTFISVLSGCIEFGTEIKDSGIKNKTVTMTAQEHNTDIIIDTDLNDDYSLLYKSLNDGDTLIIKDTIDGLYYNPNLLTTTFIFEWNTEEGTDYLELVFDGNLMDSYNITNKVVITVKIKYVNFTYENFNFEMEIYKEQWENQEYYKSDIDSGGNGFKPLPKSCIELI